MISQAVEYSLRAMALLVQQSAQPLTVQSLAEQGQIPAPYLSKLLQRLARGGLVQAQRGVGGGYSLTRDPAEITLADVVNVVEPLQRITKCPLGITGHVQLCPLHRRLDDALATVEKAFRETTLADLLEESRGTTPLCSPTPLTRLALPKTVRRGSSARR